MVPSDITSVFESYTSHPPACYRQMRFSWMSTPRTPCPPLCGKRRHLEYIMWALRVLSSSLDLPHEYTKSWIWSLTYFFESMKIRARQTLVIIITGFHLECLRSPDACIRDGRAPHAIFSTHRTTNKWGMCTSVTTCTDRRRPEYAPSPFLAPRGELTYCGSIYWTLSFAPGSAACTLPHSP